MLKNLLLFICLFSISFKINAQSENKAIDALNSFNKYLIKLDSNVTFNTQTTSVFIKQICAANTINFNTLTKYFEVLTSKDLEQNIIEGKLRKNSTLMTEYIFLGKVKYTPVDLSNPTITK